MKFRDFLNLLPWRRSREDALPTYSKQSDASSTRPTAEKKSEGDDLAKAFNTSSTSQPANKHQKSHPPHTEKNPSDPHDPMQKWAPLKSKRWENFYSLPTESGCPLWKAPALVKDLLPTLKDMYPDVCNFACLVAQTDLLHDGQPKGLVPGRQYYRLTKGAKWDGDQSFHVLTILQGDDGKWYNVGFYSNYWSNAWTGKDSVKLWFEERDLTANETSRVETFPLQPREHYIYSSEPPPHQYL
jgi:hypothetical protein